MLRNRAIDRRKLLSESLCGFGSLAFASMLQQKQVQAESRSALSPKPPHLQAKAKSVIFLFMAGGPSHLETFDPKPLLNQLDGQVRPQEFGEAKYQFVKKDARLQVPSEHSNDSGKAE